MNKLLLILSLSVLALSLAACNTMEGFGQDVQKGGQEIEEEANENK